MVFFRGKGYVKARCEYHETGVDDDETGVDRSMLRQLYIS